MLRGACRCLANHAYNVDAAKRPLIVGINSYGGDNDLEACVSDAKAIAAVLSRHKDGEKNFDCDLWPDKTADGFTIIRPKLRAAL